MKNTFIKTLLITIVSTLVFQGCSEQNGDSMKSDLKSSLLENQINFMKFDTVQTKVVSFAATTFESAIKKSLENKEFLYLRPHLDSTVYFSIMLGDDSYQSKYVKYRIIDVLNNIVSQYEMINYTLYVNNFVDSFSTSSFYVLVLEFSIGPAEIEMNILFSLDNGIIKSIKFY